MTRARSFLLISLFIFLVGASGAQAQSCANCIFLACHSPATAAPPNLWGEIEPSDTGVLPRARDTSHEDDYANPELLPRWISVDPSSDGWLFALTTYRLQIWNLANPDQPSKVADLGLSGTGLQYNVTGHTPQVFSQVRVAPDNSNTVAIGAIGAVGVSMFRTSNKSQPALLYQDGNKNVERVYTARIGSTNYAFAAGDLVGTGVRAYNMTAAAGLGSPCYDAQPGFSTCPSVHVGAVGASTFTKATGVDGVGNFLAVSTLDSFAPGGFLIYNVSNPAAPVQVMHGLAGQDVYAVAMWQEGASYYVAVRLKTQGLIYNVSCIAGGSCAAGNSIWSQSMPTSSASRISFSRSNGTPVLYWGRGLSCGNSTTGELLHEVTNPASPRSLVSAAYFRHYHWDTPTGFNYFSPMEGRFFGDRFYRAGRSLLDIHRWVGNSGPPVPPTIGSVSATPNPASVCQDVQFTANNVVNGAGATFEWEVRTSGQSLVTGLSGTNLNPFDWDTTGAAPGQYFARLVVENAAGPSVAKDSPLVTVNGLVALPGAGTFAPTKVSDNAGAVTFNVAAAGATEWSWDFGDGAGFGPWLSNPTSGPGPTHVYSSTGSKTVRVQVRNCAAGPVTSSGLVINVPLVNPLVANFAFQSCAFQQAGPTCFTGGGLSFVDSSTGAQVWDYDWDCKQGGSGCNSFEDSGNTSPDTSHVYNSAGTYTPQLRVKRGAAEVSAVFTHGPITVVGQGSEPTCGDGSCQAGETNANCPSDCPAGPVCGDGICHLSEITCTADCGGGGGASINISGPTSGSTNTSYNYSASASGCTPAASGWSWSHSGSGSSTSSSISISWATTGTKNITVSNSACSGASDSHSTTLSSAGSGVLVAAFTSQVNGLTVTFNASSSQGGPTAYAWDFGDGQNGEGATPQHTYAAAGSYTVTLSVTKQDPLCTFGLCNNEKSSVVVVGGGGPPPPPPPPPNNGLCQPDADTFCAMGGDFKIEVDWEKSSGETGVGRIVSGATSGNTGIFYFFDAPNWELLLKVLDGCAINNHFWVFGGAATNVKYQIRVTDLVTNDVWTYDNPQGKSSDAITDTRAFATCGVDRSLMRDNATAGGLEPRISLDDPNLPPTDPPPPPPNVGPCDPNSSTLCAIAERFRVRVSWETKAGVTGNGTVVPQVTDNTGVFWFFEQDNWELLIKVLNGCAINDRFWVFGAGATDVRYVVTVDDLVSGATWEYENAQGHASPAITDTSAFDTCP